jgi:tetratricopeptide (TPR) repeat protein
MLNEEARELARANNFPPAVVSGGIDLLLNYARRLEVGRAEKLIEPTERAVIENGGWHGWLWRIRLAQARAEIALARADWAEAVRSAEECIAQSREKGRIKYELLGRWTRARALDALGRCQEAIAELNGALNPARQLGDPAMFLRIAAALLAIDGSDSLAAEAGATVQQILAVLPDETMRQRFEAADPVRLVRKLAQC